MKYNNLYKNEGFVIMVDFNIVEFKKDSLIFVAGEKARDIFYIIKEGSVIDKNYVVDKIPVLGSGKIDLKTSKELAKSLMQKL